MTVTLDPSELRNQTIVKARPLAGPLRVALAAGLGGAGLIAFTYGAFSFFGGLADPRMRPARPAVVAASLPDFKDGLPALTSDAAAPKATVLNLPKPPASQAEKVEIGLRPDPLPPAEAAAPAPVRTASADATALLAPAPAAAKPAKRIPAIENAQTVSGDPKPVTLVAPAKLTGPLAPAKAETVRAKAVESRAVAALTPEVGKLEAVKPETAKLEQTKPEPATAPAAPKRAAAPPKPAKVKTAKVQPATETAEAAPAPAPVAAPKPDEDEDGIGSKLKSGIKAIGGIFGGE